MEICASLSPEFKRGTVSNIYVGGFCMVKWGLNSEALNETPHLEASGSDSGEPETAAGRRVGGYYDDATDSPVPGHPFKLKNHKKQNYACKKK